MLKRPAIFWIIGAALFVALLIYARKPRANSLYTFKQGHSGLGEGVDNLAQLQFQGKPPQGVPMSKRYRAARSFAPLSPTVYNPPIQETPITAPLPDIAYLPGDFWLLPLTKGAK